jgi:hypothetical protein
MKIEPFTEATQLVDGTRVEVYWNLHADRFSVRALEGFYKGLVVAHLPSVNLTDVTFTVQPAGRAKVLREQRKNVHAFVRGRIHLGEVPNLLRLAVTYNPYRDETFVDGVLHEPVHTAQLAVCQTRPDGRPSVSIA